MATSEYAAALRLTQRLLELDPHNPDTYNLWGEAYEFAGDFDRAAATYREGLRIDPINPLLNMTLGRLQRKLGNEREAIGALQTAMTYMPRDSTGLSSLAYSLWLAGRPAEAAELASEWQERFGDDPFTWKGGRVWNYLALDRVDEAFAELQNAVETRYPWGFGMILIKVNFWGDPVLERPEFVELRRQLGFGG